VADAPTLRTLGAADAGALAELAARPDVVRMGDHLDTRRASDWAAWIGPPERDGAPVLGAFEDGALVAAAKLEPRTRRRVAHSAKITLVASEKRRFDRAVDALLDALVDAADRWLQIVRLDLAGPAGHRRLKRYERRGFALEAIQRGAILTDGEFIDEATFGRIRPGTEPYAPPPSNLELPWPPKGPRIKAKIRQAREEDGPAVAEMMAETTVVWGTMQIPFQSPGMWGARFATNPPDRFFTYVAEHRGAILGMASVILLGELRRRHVGSVGMSVATRAQGRGVGRALLERLLQTADALRVHRVELGVYVDNDRAIRLYERCGFVREGKQRLLAFRDGGWVDNLVMARVRAS